MRFFFNWIYLHADRVFFLILSYQVDSEEHTKVKNGKKICWNFRKGRCRFGSNCTYAHDSDLHKPDDAVQQSACGTGSNAQVCYS